MLSYVSVVYHISTVTLTTSPQKRVPRLMTGRQPDAFMLVATVEGVIKALCQFSPIYRTRYSLDQIDNEAVQANNGESSAVMFLVVRSTRGHEECG